MSGFTLKLLALVLMIIDHCGLVLFAGTSWYLPCRILGRIAFPLYTFLITEGYVHTRNVKKYAGRLLVFAFISEIPFDYAFFGTPVYMGYQNVFFTLVLGLAALICFDAAAGASKRDCTQHGKSIGDNGSASDWERKLFCSGIAKVLVILILVIAEFACTDYGAFGVLLILLFYLFREQKVICTLAVSAALISYGWLGGFHIEGFGALALIPIVLYNGKKGEYPFPSIFFYAAYPVHLLILGLVVRGMAVW